VNYQKLVCWGDSQTFGARTYGCIPLYLAKELNQTTRYRWSALNCSRNGDTARDLWFRITREAPALQDFYRACILIGAHDVAKATPVPIFAEYYRQILDTLEICGWRVVHCGEIPPLWPDGHAFFDRDSLQRRELYNESLRQAVADSPIAQLVTFPELSSDCYVDPVHFNEQGNAVVSRAFAASIRGS
jgi:hypothetical protein